MATKEQSTKWFDSIRSMPNHLMAFTWPDSRDNDFYIVRRPMVHYSIDENEALVDWVKDKIKNRFV